MPPVFLTVDAVSTFVALSAIWIRGLRGIELRGTDLRVMDELRGTALRGNAARGNELRGNGAQPHLFHGSGRCSATHSR